MRHNLIVQTSEGLLQYLLKLIPQFENNVPIHYETIRKELFDLINNVEMRLESISGMYEKVTTVKYILVTLIDHVLTFSDWEGASKWRDNLFEMAFFDTCIGGDRFFELLMDEGLRDPELAEFFFLCLNFLGPNHSDAGLDICALKQRLYHMIPERISENERMITPDAEKMITKKEKIRSPIMGFWLFFIMIAAFSLIYITCSIWIWEDAVKVITEISEQLMERGC